MMTHATTPDPDVLQKCIGYGILDMVEARLASFCDCCSVEERPASCGCLPDFIDDF